MALAEKNRLIETALLSTYNLRFCQEIRKIIFNNVSLSGGLFANSVDPDELANYAPADLDLQFVTDLRSRVVILLHHVHV